MKRDEYKDLPKGYYHLSTDGRWGGIIFHTPELFAYGMVLMGLVTLQFPIEIYAFTLMDNHIHIVLSGTGSTCRELFHYLVRKLNTKLRTAGYPELPEDYGFKLVPIDSPWPDHRWGSGRTLPSCLRTALNLTAHRSPSVRRAGSRGQ